MHTPHVRNNVCSDFPYYCRESIDLGPKWVLINDDTNDAKPFSSHFTALYMYNQSTREKKKITAGEIFTFMPNTAVCSVHAQKMQREPQQRIWLLA